MRNWVRNTLYSGFGMLVGFGAGFYGNEHKDLFTGIFSDFDLDSYESGTDYEVVMESRRKDGNWKFENRIKIDSVSGLKLDLTSFPPELIGMKGEGRDQKGRRIRGEINKLSKPLDVIAQNK